MPYAPSYYELMSGKGVLGTLELVFFDDADPGSQAKPSDMPPSPLGEGLFAGVNLSLHIVSKEHSRILDRTRDQAP